MLAEMLTKAIRANVAHDARPAPSTPHRPNKESAMSDTDTSTTADATATDATAADASLGDATTGDTTATGATTDTTPTNTDTAPADTTTTDSAATNTVPASSAPASSGTEVDDRLQKIAALVQTLKDDPKIFDLLTALLGTGSTDSSATTSD